MYAFLILCGLGAFAQEDGSSSVKIKITGEIDRASQTSSLWIIRQNDTHKYPTAEVPIVDGKIDYVFETSEPDRFYFISMQDILERGVCMPLDFFAENGEIQLSGKDTEDEMQCLKLTLERTTAPLNKKLLEYNQFRHSTFYQKTGSIAALVNTIPEDEYYSEEGKAFWNEFNILMESISQYPDSLELLQQWNAMFSKRDEMERERTMYSQKYYQLYDQLLEVNSQMLNYEIETFGTPDGDIFNLSILCENFYKTYDNDAVKERIIDVYTRYFKERFSGTAMGRRMTDGVIGYEVNHIGGRYPDYQLPDAQGNLHSIRDLIQDNVVLIDLWGSTCGPCRINSRSMIPVYDEFKDRGFDIIGIAREYHNLGGFHQALEKDGYPWLQLIELDDATGIFNLHGIANAMGGTYLVGPSKSKSKAESTSNETSSDIRVLLINPSAEELRAFLSDYLSSKE